LHSGRELGEGDDRFLLRCQVSLPPGRLSERPIPVPETGPFDQKHKIPRPKTRRGSGQIRVWSAGDEPCAVERVVTVPLHRGGKGPPDAPCGVGPEPPLGTTPDPRISPTS